MLIQIKYLWSVVRLNLLLAIMLVPGQSLAQDSLARKYPLTIEKGSHVWLSDSLCFFPNDTIIYLSTRIIKEKDDPYTRTSLFYDSLKVKASRSKLGNKLYDLAIILPAETKNVQ